MRSLFFGCLLALCISVAQGQGLEPKYDIPSSIAKVPEQFDFIGSWTRGDGTYRVEVIAGKTPGTVMVKYFNPEPINVESAVFDTVDDLPRLTFVLRDEGYPGSTYQLEFYSERRVLYGQYTRPGAAPSEVYFINDNE